MSDTYDAILIPGGGLANAQSPHPWVIQRLELALKRWQPDTWLLCLSAGTPHRAPPLDAEGFPVFESVAAARYLLQQGMDAAHILTETCSYDTLGNAYFSRLLHAEPRQWRRLLVISSAFHLPRTAAAFRWLYGLDDFGCHLEFEAAPDVGMDAALLAARRHKEAQALAAMQQLQARLPTLAAFHAWLFSEHAAYSAAGQLQRWGSDDAPSRDSY